MPTPERPTPPGIEHGWWERHLREWDRLAMSPESLRVRWDRAMLSVDDPELHDVIEAALAPLDIDDVSDTVVASVRPRRRRMPPADLARIVVGHDLLAEIRDHARSVESEHEIAGRLVVANTGHARRYDRLVNHDTRPRRVFFGRSSWRREDDEFGLLVHSHPSGGREPSNLDGELLRRNRTIAIWHATTKSLGVFTLGDDGKSLIEVEVVTPPLPDFGEIEFVGEPVVASGGPRRRRGFLVDLDEHLVFNRNGAIVPSGFSAFERFRRQTKGW